jgi:Fur family transcriptional regulator, ferric uptake regulator
MEVHIMKRDLDLARQLLLDIEARGADCSVSALQNTNSRSSGTHEPHAPINSINHDIDECIRYHLRLLIDGGFLKEVDRTAAGVPCVRLTHEGCELLELARHESLWREAKCLCEEHTGGQALTVIRTFLMRLAVGPHGFLPRVRDGYARRPRYLATTERPTQNRVRYVRVRPTTEEMVERPLQYLADVETEGRYDLEYEGAFPTHLIWTFDLSNDSLKNRWWIEALLVRVAPFFVAIVLLANHLQLRQTWIIPFSHEVILAATVKVDVKRDTPWAKGILKQAGLRSTAARVGVLRHLSDLGKPVSHGEVTDALSEFGFDQSTIYRVLHELAGAGLLTKLDLGDQIRRFEFRSSQGEHELEHPHFMCVDCGKVTCLEDFSFQLTPSRGPRRDKLGEITEVLLRGHCNKCSHA